MIIVVMAVSGVGVALGAVFKSRLREGTTRVISAARFAYHRATTQGVTTRLALNLDKHTFSIEESDGAVPVPTPKAPDDDKQGRWKSARNSAAQGLSLEKPEALFFPLSDAEGNELRRYKDQRLGDNVRFRSVRLPENDEVIDRGMAYVHFLPGGYAEGGVILLEGEDERRLTLSIAPLTAETQVLDGEDLPAWIEGRDEGLLDDPDN